MTRIHSSLARREVHTIDFNPDLAFCIVAGAAYPNRRTCPWQTSGFSHVEPSAMEDWPLD